MRNKILFAFLGIIIIICLNFFQNEVKNFFYIFSSPFQGILLKSGDYVSDFFQTVLEIKNQKKENEKLRRKIQEISAENESLKSLAQENDILRQALNANPRKEFQYFISRIISKDIMSSDTILVRGGSGDGLQKGFSVITPESALVGKIEKVYNNFSEVKLISSKDFSFDVKIIKDQDNSSIKNEILGLAKGKGGLTIYLDKVQLGADIKEGDVLSTAALGGVFPENLLVGKVGKVRKSDTEPFQQAEILPFFNIKEAQILFVITKW